MEHESRLLEIEIALQTGDVQVACKSSLELIRQAQQGGLQQLEAEAWLLHGKALQRLGAEDEGLEAKEKSLEILRKIQCSANGISLAKALTAVASSLVDKGDRGCPDALKQSLAYNKEALNLARLAGDDALTCWCSIKVGNMEFPEFMAIQAFEETLERAKCIEDEAQRHLILATCCSYYGHYLSGLRHRGRGWREEYHDVEKGGALLQEAFQLACQIGDWHLKIHGLRNLGRMHERRKNFEEAHRSYDLALKMFEEKWSQSNTDHFRLLQRDSYLHREISQGLQRSLLSRNLPQEALLVADATRARAFIALMQDQKKISREELEDLSWELLMKVLHAINSSVIYYSMLDEATCCVWVLKNAALVGWRIIQLQNAPGGPWQGSFSEFLLRSRGDLGATLRGDEDPDVEGQGENLRAGWERRKSRMEATAKKLQTCYDLLFRPIADLISEEDLYIFPDQELWVVPSVVFFRSQCL